MVNITSEEAQMPAMPRARPRLHWRASHPAEPVADAAVAQVRPEPHVNGADRNRDGADAFVIAGINPSDRLRRASGVTGISWENLDELARPPHAHEPQGSTSGLDFNNPDSDSSQKRVTYPRVRHSSEGMLAADTHMRDVMMTDNDTVLDQGLTHQAVADPLLAGMAAFHRDVPSADVSALEPYKHSFALAFHGGHTSFEYRGRRYTIEGQRMQGFWSNSHSDARNPAINGLHDGWRSGDTMTQGSIFDDELFASWVYTIRDVETGAELRGDALTPHMIFRYGFYQGGAYRMSPQRIIDFFRLTGSPR